MSRKQICRQAQEYYRDRLVLGWEERLGNDVEINDKWRNTLFSSDVFVCKQ